MCNSALITLRERKKLKKIDVAKMAGISKQHYSRLELGQCGASVRVWESIRTILEAPSIDYLLNTDDRAS